MYQWPPPGMVLYGAYGVVHMLLSCVVHIYGMVLYGAYGVVLCVSMASPAPLWAATMHPLAAAADIKGFSQFS